MRSSKVLSFIGVLLFTMVVSATWVGARSYAGNAGEETTSNQTYLPIVTRPMDPLVFEMERDALVALYRSTHGDEWYQRGGWLETNDHCHWYGVRCKNGRVTGLDLNDNQLVGYIPPQLGSLNYLELLNLSYNQLSDFPPELGNLTDLQELYLEDNQLSGPIPPELVNLSSLGELNLAHNQLSGTIPPELGNLTNLWGLYLFDNQLSGPIPPELGNLTNLGGLYLFDNQLSGSIPPELGNLSSLGELNLANNQLSGPILRGLDNLTNLYNLELADNQLECWETAEVLKWALSIPDHSWDNPPGTTICELENPVYLPIVAHLALDIETEFDVLVALYQTTDGENWTNQSGWLVDEDHCNWYGVTCVDGYVQGLNLSNNQLSGPILKELDNLDQLQILILGGNQLSGPIPPELSKLSNLTILNLGNNALYGSIPEVLGNLSILERLVLGGNLLRGNIPPKLGKLANLKSLVLGGNQLEGFIPQELGNLGNLENLVLGGNQLKGIIPKELSNLTKLQNLRLINNQLSCWETAEVLEWARSVPEAIWDNPPGIIICEYYP